MTCPRDIPAWLQVKIAAIQKEEHSQLYVVSEYRISGEHFITLQNPLTHACLVNYMM